MDEIVWDDTPQLQAPETPLIEEQGITWDDAPVEAPIAEVAPIETPLEVDPQTAPVEEVVIAPTETIQPEAQPEEKSLFEEFQSPTVYSLLC